VDGIRVVRVPPSGPGRTGKFLMVPAAFRAVPPRGAGPRRGRRAGTRVLGLPGLTAARATRLGVVMQPETNGELSGEAWTWGKTWAGGAAGRLARSALRGAQLAAARRGRVRRDVAGDSGRDARRRGPARGSRSFPTVSTRSDSGRPSPVSARRCGPGWGCRAGSSPPGRAACCGARGWGTLLDAFARRPETCRTCTSSWSGSGEVRPSRSRTSSGAEPARPGSRSGWSSPGGSRGGGRAARGGPVRLPIGLRGARHLARGGGGLRLPAVPAARRHRGGRRRRPLWAPRGAGDPEALAEGLRSLGKDPGRRPRWTGGATNRPRALRPRATAWTAIGPCSGRSLLVGLLHPGRNVLLVEVEALLHHRSLELEREVEREQDHRGEDADEVEPEVAGHAVDRGERLGQVLLDVTSS